MTISKKGTEFIAAFEGCYTKAYHDSGGVLTIGYGHTGDDVTEGQTITKAEALKIFKKDLGHYKPRQATTKQNEYDALTSYHFNCGNYASEDMRIMANKIHDAKSNRLKGLIRRRIAELILFYEGVYDTSPAPLANAFTRLDGEAKGYQVALIQWACRIINNDYTLKVDGIKGPLTTKALEKAQRIAGTRADGIAGVKTRAAFYKLLKNKIY